jgi:hypothetical protein
MNIKHWRGALAAVVLGMILVGCGAGRTMVMEAPAERRTFASATVEDGKDSVTMPAEFRTRLTEKVKAGLYGDAEKPGSFNKEGAGLTIRLKVVQFDSGSQFQRWVFGGLGNQGEASMHVLAEFYEGDKKLAHIQTEGRIGSGAFGGSVNSAVDKAAAEIVEYAAANFR